MRTKTTKTKPSWSVMGETMRKVMERERKLSGLHPRESMSSIMDRMSHDDWRR